MMDFYTALKEKNPRTPREFADVYEQIMGNYDNWTNLKNNPDVWVNQHGYGVRNTNIIPQKTSCKNGLHEMVESNVRTDYRGYRTCKACYRKNRGIDGGR